MHLRILSDTNGAVIAFELSGDPRHASRRPAGWGSFVPSASQRYHEVPVTPDVADLLMANGPAFRARLNVVVENATARLDYAIPS